MFRAFLAAAALALTVPMLAPSFPAEARVQEIPETKDRLSQAAMERLVAKPMVLVRSAGLKAGQREFDVLLGKARRVHGQNSVRVADMLTAFGVLLYSDGLDRDDTSLKTASAEYLKAAIPAYRAAFSPKHPEVALALTSYADVELALHPDNPSNAEPFFEEAAAIRLKALGPDNLETRAAMLKLAEVQGSPAIVMGDARRLQRAVTSFENLIEIAPRGEEGLSGPRVRTALAQIYARNGQSGKAIAELRRAQAEMQDWSEEERCSAQSGATFLVVSELEKVGETELAHQLTTDPEYLARLRCTPPIRD